MPYAEHTLPPSDLDRSAFFDAMDEIAGGGDYGPLPEAWYEFMVSLKEFKLSAKGQAMARLEFTVCNDADGFDGRKVWVNAMLEGADSSGRSQTWFLAKLLKGMAVQYGRDTAMALAPFPGWDPATKLCTVQRDPLTLEPDWTMWQSWFDVLANYPVLAKVKHKAGREKDASGNWVKSATVKEADITEFKVAEKEVA